jgi:competence protein ComEA
MAATLLATQVALLWIWIDSNRRQGLVDIDQQTSRKISLLVDLNSADASELALLPDIGETLAERTVSWRTEHGPFRSHQDLLQVRGIGPKTLDKLRPYLAPIDIPTAANGPLNR